MSDDQTADVGETQAPKPADETTLPDGSRRVTLRKPIRELDAARKNIVNIDELIFREPTAEDIEIAGNPVMLDDKLDVKWNEGKMSAMMARLAGVHLSSIRKIAASDWTNCAWAITPFFMPWFGKTSSSAPTS
jgi:hypothetical protein